MIEPALGTHSSDRRAKAVNDGHAARGRQEIGQAGKRTLAGCAEAGANMRLVGDPAGGAAPQPRGHALETRLAGKAADEIARNDQLAALAINMAQHGFGSGYAVQTNLALGEVDVHGRISLSMGIRSVDSTD